MKRRDWGAFTHKNWHSFTWWQRKCAAFCQAAILPTHFLRRISPEQGRIGKLVPLLLEWMDFALSQRCKLVEKLSASVATWVGNNWENLNICSVQFSIQDGGVQWPPERKLHMKIIERKSQKTHGVHSIISLMTGKYVHVEGERYLGWKWKPRKAPQLAKLSMYLHTHAD